jgi:hypothetical protein
MTSFASIITAFMALLAVLNKDISASLAGFALAFSGTGCPSMLVKMSKLIVALDYL